MSSTRLRGMWIGCVLVCSVVLGSWQPRAGETAVAAEKHVTAAVSPAEALQRLKDGNRRFVAGKPLHERQNAAWRGRLVAAQQPFAAILGCSDSRVPLELIFDQGFGDLFAVRVAGNVAGGDERGSLQYAVAHLHVPLVVVLGHERCGAVAAALLPESERAKEADGVQELVARIEPGLKAPPASGGEAERIQRAVEDNVRWSLQQLRDAPVLKQKIDAGEIRLVGGVYELEGGSVRWLSE